jgi:hypothetical protein
LTTNSRVVDVVERVATLKWRWAGYVVRYPDYRLAKARWTGDITKIVGHAWMSESQDRNDLKERRDPMFSNGRKQAEEEESG